MGIMSHVKRQALFSQIPVAHGELAIRCCGPVLRVQDLLLFCLPWISAAWCYVFFLSKMVTLAEARQSQPSHSSRLSLGTGRVEHRSG
jgi:hypothetical protein